MFHQLLEDQGIAITSQGVFCDEPSRSIRKLESALRVQSNRLDEFIECLESYLSDSLEQSLQPTCQHTNHAISQSSRQHHGLSSSNQHFGIGTGDSFLKLLLRVQPLQERLIAYLVEKIIELSQEDQDIMSQSTSLRISKSANSIALNVLNHIRWYEIHFSSSPNSSRE
jgi:hypothetical protein